MTYKVYVLNCISDIMILKSLVDIKKFRLINIILINSQLGPLIGKSKKHQQVKIKDKREFP